MITLKTEPNFRTHAIEWIAWNMNEYDNDIETATTLLKQKQIIDAL